MAKQTAQIAGQRPKVKWKRNIGRKRRTIEEAAEIAAKHGVQIPEDVMFFEADAGELAGSLKDFLNGGEMTTAKGPAMTERSDGYIYWSDHFSSVTGKIPFRIHPDVLTSDECIVGVYAHEMAELAMLREVFVNSRKNRMNAGDYGSQVLPGFKGNFHDQAWDVSDQLVIWMRGAKK